MVYNLFKCGSRNTQLIRLLFGETETILFAILLVSQWRYSEFSFCSVFSRLLLVAKNSSVRVSPNRTDLNGLKNRTEASLVAKSGSQVRSLLTWVLPTWAEARRRCRWLCRRRRRDAQTFSSVSVCCCWLSCRILHVITFRRFSFVATATVVTR